VAEITKRKVPRLRSKAFFEKRAVDGFGPIWHRVCHFNAMKKGVEPLVAALPN